MGDKNADDNRDIWRSRRLQKRERNTPQTSFLDWIDELKGIINVNIDGKTIRRGRGDGKKAKHIVTDMDKKVIEKEADYVLALKRNHDTLHEDVSTFLDSES